MKQITLKLTNPKLDIDNLSINKLNLYAGANGTGKSIILQSSYIIQTGINFCEKGLSKSEICKGLTEIFTMSYDPPITGLYGTSHENGDVFEFTVDNNIVTDYKYINAGKSFQTITPLFLSTRTRLLSGLPVFINAWDKFKVDKNQTEFYQVCSDLDLKFWDITFYMMFTEQLRGLNSNKVIHDIIMKELNNFNMIQEAFVSIQNLRLDGNKIMISCDNKPETNLQSYGNGHKAIFTMVVSTILQKHNSYLLSNVKRTI